MSTALSLQSVTKTYKSKSSNEQGKVTAPNSVNFELQEGELVLVNGPMAQGNPLIADCVALLKPDSESLTLMGRTRLH